MKAKYVDILILVALGLFVSSITLMQCNYSYTHYDANYKWRYWITTTHPYYTFGTYLFAVGFFISVFAFLLSLYIRY